MARSQSSWLTEMYTRARKVARWGLRNGSYYRRRLGGLVRGHGFRDVPPKIDPAVLRGEGDLYSATTLDANALRYPSAGNLADNAAANASDTRMISAICRSAHVDSPAFRYWVARLGLKGGYHRKYWEFAAICQALYERNLLQAGRRGLGFAVGREPLPALFAAFGCQIVATDLASNDQRAAAWARTNQWGGELDMLTYPEICAVPEFRERVTYQPVDMNHIPATLRDFDFTWSSCSFEHCGTIELGQRFLLEQMKCLKPGGWAVHTTEINLSSNEETITKGATVTFRRRDIEAMIHQLRAEGHYVEPLDLNVGSAPVDAHVDVPPHTNQHLRLRLGKWASTSIVLLIRKGQQA